MHVASPEEWKLQLIIAKVVHILGGKTGIYPLFELTGAKR